ncbi:MAG: YceD family protein [Steroidobacteraceae bacterium]
MSEGWSRQHEVERLADGRQSFDVSIPLRHFPRLAGQLAENSGDAHVIASFSRELGLAVADVSVDAALTLTCQRCLAAMRWPVTRRSHVVLVPDLAAADRVAPGVDPVMVEHGRTSIRDLAEEELLLALPLVAMHAEAAQCGGVAVDAAPDVEPEKTHKPFAQLGELLKRNR